MRGKMFADMAYYLERKLNSMELLLPDIDWQNHKLTSIGQIKKIGEESWEVAEALMSGDLENAVRETLDTIQTGYTMLRILQEKWEKEYHCMLPLGNFLAEHEEKLQKKGYLKEKNDHALDSVF